jgi:hypothetical protein
VPDLTKFMPKMADVVRQRKVLFATLRQEFLLFV